jgi:hypothetical protein
MDTVTRAEERTLSFLSMNRWIGECGGGFVNGGLVDNPFPLTPTLSLGEREHRSGLVCG